MSERNIRAMGEFRHSPADFEVLTEVDYPLTDDEYDRYESAAPMPFTPHAPPVLLLMILLWVFALLFGGEIIGR